MVSAIPKLNTKHFRVIRSFRKVGIQYSGPDCTLLYLWCLYKASNLCKSLKRLFLFKQVNVYTLPLDLLMSTVDDVDNIFEKPYIS